MLHSGSVFSCWYSDFPDIIPSKKKENKIRASENNVLHWKRHTEVSGADELCVSLKCRVFWLSVVVLGFFTSCLCLLPAHLCVVSSSASVHSSLWFFLHSSSVCLFLCPLASSLFQLLFGFCSHFSVLVFVLSWILLRLCCFYCFHCVFWTCAWLLKLAASLSWSIFCFNNELNDWGHSLLWIKEALHHFYTSMSGKCLELMWKCQKLQFLKRPPEAAYKSS